MAVEWEKSQAAFLHDHDDEYPTEKQRTERQLWEARLAANSMVTTKPKTLNSVHKIVADAITRLLALVRARSVRNAPKTTDYEGVLELMGNRIDDLFDALEKANTSDT